MTINLDDGSQIEVSRTLHCAYVRRNIRHLLPAERENYFDAFHAMYSLTTLDGVKQFGSNFRSLREFVDGHLTAAGLRNADRFHDGMLRSRAPFIHPNRPLATRPHVHSIFVHRSPSLSPHVRRLTGMGFLTQHAALTNEFELSIQSVYPQLAVPYWDYTEDGELVHTHKTLEVAWSQDIWDEHWFGNATTDGDHFVKKGRFAYQQVYRSDDDAVVTNAYGFMRAPWNTAKSEYVTRVHKFCQTSYSHESWPFCADHYNMTFGSTYDAWYEWIWTAGYAAHGPIHYYIGGYTNCGDLTSQFEEIGLGQPQVDDFSLWMVQLRKNFWRSYVTEAPESCSHDTPQDQCHMKCSLHYKNKKEVEDFMSMLKKWVYGIGNSGRVPTDATWIAALNETQAAGLMKIYCETPFTPGEQIEAASPIDPSFWPIHPTMERLLQYKRVVQDFGDMYWGATKQHGDGTNYCTQGISSHYAESYLNVSSSDSWLDLGCEGHHADDLNMFKSNVVDPQTGKYQMRSTTNLELFRMINPKEYMVSYIYENFEWTHCDRGAYAFPEVDWAS